MTQQTVNIGVVAGDGTGDRGQVPFQKVNANFSELYGNAVYYGVDSGVVNAYIVTLASLKPNPLTTPLAVGTLLRLIVSATNNSSATLNFAAGGAVGIIGANGLALTGGEMQAGVPTWLQWNGTNWQVVGSDITPDKARTPSELSAGVTPTNYAYGPGDVRRYGTNTTPGTTDMTVPIKNALLSNQRVYLISGTYLCTAALPMLSGQVFYGDGDTSILTFNTATIDNITMSTITGAKVRDLKIVVTPSGGTGTTAGVHMLNCTKCFVEDCEFVGQNWAGVWLDGNCVKCEVRGNTFDSFQTGTNIDAPDITLYNSQGGTGCYYCIVDDNDCFGNGSTGIEIQDARSATTSAQFPFGNVISNNRVGQHKDYGIIVYMPGNLGTPPPATDTFNQVIGNYIENIQGGSTQNTSSGAGIYTVGLGSGATLIANNTINNCCVATLNRTLAPAGIGINGCTGPTAISVTGNNIANMVQGDGILAVSSTVGPSISGGSINIPSTNAGAGPGGANLAGSCIRIEATSGATVTGVNCKHAGTGRALFVYANGANCNDVEWTGVTCICTGTETGFGTVASGGAINNLVLNGVKVTTTSNNAFSISAVTGGTMTGCYGVSTTQPALRIDTATLFRVVGGSYVATGGTNIQTTATVCTGSYIDKSVYFTPISGSGSLLSNAATGLIVECLLNGAPAGGTWAVGDTIQNATPTAAGIAYWKTTTAGTGGGTAVFKTISNT